MTDGPTEILVQILSRLPVKSLLRFWCVSKPWCELIDSPYFIKSHLNQSAKTNTNLNALFGGLSTLYSVDLDSPECATKFDNPLKRDKYGAKVLGSCNGLVCLSTTSASDNEISLWNPLTGKCKRVPEMPVHFSPNSSRRFCIEGFGYDNDDYKLVRVVQSCNIDSNFVESEINVYSLKSDSWRRVGDFPYYICYQRSYGAFANGALQWVVSKKPEPNIDYLIAAFDLGTEEFHLLPQPRYLDKILNINLGVLGNCLSVICNHHMLCVDIWVMKEYGVKESWTKLISIARPDGFKPSPYVRPLAYSKSGREVLLEEDSEKLVWYDLVKKTIQVVTIRDMPPYFVADAYLGSLVQPKSAG